jgi:hypothetical protein
VILFVFVQQEEDRDRRRKADRADSKHRETLEIEDLEGLDLNSATKPIPKTESREERFRNKNEIANRLAGWSADGSDKPEMGDFRRKKVKWFD